MFRGLSNDLYHRLLRVSWAGLIGMFAGLYVLMAGGFGLAYYLLDGAVAGVGPDSLQEHVWFSVQTISTIGYGEMVPATPAAHVLVALESFLGLIGFALATGLIFSKFSRPTARVRFSDVVTVRPRDETRTLHLRVANERSTDVVEASVALYLIRDEVTAEGDCMRRFYPLEIERESTPVFSYSFTVMHRLESGSPLRDLQADNAEEHLNALVVTFTGIDDAMASEVHARYAYGPDDLVFGERFIDMVEFDGPGEPETLAIDEIDETEPLPENG